eukprot:922970_1
MRRVISIVEFSYLFGQHLLSFGHVMDTIFIRFSCAFCLSHWLLLYLAKLCVFVTLRSMSSLLHFVLSIIVVLLTTCYAQRVYECHDTNCYVNCSSIGSSTSGCKDFDVLDTSNAQHVTIDCTSSNPYHGGCELLSILCPLTGDCTVNCNDYYACYGTNITAGSNSAISASLTVNCNHPDSSCSDTIIHAPHIRSLNVNCVGADGSFPSSLSSVTCHKMKIHATHVQNEINMHCASDYACSNNILYANDSNSALSIQSIGLFSFYQNTIYAPQSSAFSMFCASEAYSMYANNQFGGCSASTLYIPSYSTPNTPRTTIQCEGEGCYALDIYSVHGALDVNMTINGCSECDQSSCINEWTFHCGNAYETESTFTGDACTEDDCYCNHALHTVSASFIQNDMICSIFEMDYICPSDTDCTIDCCCSHQFVDGCPNKLIHGADATSLSVICNKENCRESRISCPNTEDSTCQIECRGPNSCYELEIHATQNTKQLNITCVGKDACSFIEVNALYTEQVFMDCTVSDACGNFNIFANYSDVLQLRCEPQDIDTTNDIYSSAYAACNNFHIYANDNTKQIDIQCNGDFSCYYATIYAQNAHDMRINAEGQYAFYYSHVYAQNTHNFTLFCRSEFGEQSCYRSSIYAPKYDDYSDVNMKRMNIGCEGHGCMYLNLFAINGWSDVNIHVDGCSECASVDDCVRNWNMHCGIDTDCVSDSSSCFFDKTSVFDGSECDTSKCDCDAMKASVVDTFTNHQYSECGFFAPDITCDVDTECVIDCDAYKSGCNAQTISGSNAKSLVINCNDDNGCNETNVYCPTDKNSRCDVKCVNKDSCYLTQIHGDEYNLINVDCIAPNACVNTTIAAPNANEINLLCMASNACQHVDVDATYTSMVNVICSWNQTGTACDNIHVIATHSRSAINIECDGDATCKQLFIDAEYANTIHINAIGSLAFYSGQINGAFAQQVTALLYAEYPTKYGFDNVYYDADPLLHLPAKHDNISSITCQGYGCYALNIASPNGLTDYEFNLNGCGFCDELYTCYYQWNILCGALYQDTLTLRRGRTCYADRCGCYESKDALATAWDNGNSETCDAVVSYDYECAYYDAYGYCVINCYSGYDEANSCRNKVINAINEKQGVVINCWSCALSKIYCPHAEYLCVVNCLSDDSCTYTKIYQKVKTDAFNGIRLNCSDYGSCEYTEVIAPYVTQMDLICDSTDSCYGVNVDAANADEVNVICRSSQQKYRYTNYWDYGGEDTDYYWDYPENDYWPDDDDGGWRRRLQREGKPKPPNKPPMDDVMYDMPVVDWMPGYLGAFACDQIVVDANYSSTVRILCEGDRSCYSSVFWAGESTDVNVTALGINAFDQSSLHANNAQEIYVKCGVFNNSDYTDTLSMYSVDGIESKGACVNGIFYIPSLFGYDTTTKTRFECEGYGCYDLWVYSVFGLVGVEVRIDGCFMCDSERNCISGWNVKCGKAYPFNGYTGGDRFTFSEGKCATGDGCQCSDYNVTFVNTNTCAVSGEHRSIYNSTYHPIMIYHHGPSLKILGALCLVSVILCLVCFCWINYKKKQTIIRNQGSSVNSNVAGAMGMDYVNDNNIVAIEPVEGQYTVQQEPIQGISTVNPAFIAQAAKPQKENVKGNDGNVAFIN